MLTPEVYTQLVARVYRLDWEEGDVDDAAIGVYDTVEGFLRKKEGCTGDIDPKAVLAQLRTELTRRQPVVTLLRDQVRFSREDIERWFSLPKDENWKSDHHWEWEEHQREETHTRRTWYQESSTRRNWDKMPIWDGTTRHLMRYVQKCHNEPLQRYKRAQEFYTHRSQHLLDGLLSETTVRDFATSYDVRQNERDNRTDIEDLMPATNKPRMPYSDPEILSDRSFDHHSYDDSGQGSLWFRPLEPVKAAVFDLAVRRQPKLSLRPTFDGGEKSEWNNWLYHAREQASALVVIAERLNRGWPGNLIAHEMRAAELCEQDTEGVLEQYDSATGPGGSGRPTHPIKKAVYDLVSKFLHCDNDSRSETGTQEADLLTKLSEDLHADVALNTLTTAPKSSSQTPAQLVAILLPSYDTEKVFEAYEEYRLGSCLRIRDIQDGEGDTEKP